MDKLTGNKAVIASGAHFKGEIKNARAVEINGTVEADLKAEKLTIGSGGKFIGAANAELVVISGYYDGKMEAGSIWATATAEISGKIQYQTMQLDRGAALNCRFVHNWKLEKTEAKKPADSGHGGNDAYPKDNQTAHENTEGRRAKKSGLKVKRKTDEIADGSASVAHQSDQENLSVNNGYRLFADWPKKTSPEQREKERGRRLGIFGFGSKVAKAPEA